MKKLVLGFAAFILNTTWCSAQTFMDPFLQMPRDSVTKRVNFISTVPVAGATQAELYTAARAWFQSYFVSSGKVTATLDVDDPATGRLVGTRYIIHRKDNPQFTIGPNELRNSVIFTPVAGGYRCEVTNFMVYPMKNRPEPLESVPPILNIKGNLTNATKHWNEAVIKAAYEQANALIAAIGAATSK
jgi:hypothetical protein